MKLKKITFKEKNGYWTAETNHKRKQQVAEPRERKRYQKYKKKKKTNLLFIGKKENTYTHICEK